MTLTRPDHLRRLRASRTASVVALVLGVATFVVVAISPRQLWDMPDCRISAPGVLLTVVAAIASIARRERAYPLALLGVGLAAAAAVLGWFLMLAIVVAATAALILILHSVM